MTPFYERDGITIYCGDMREIVPAVITRVDATITDPPYGVTNLPWDRWPVGWPAVLSDRSPQIWCFGSMAMFLKRFHEFKRWKMAQDLVWEKHNGSSLHADRFRRVHEHVIHFYRGRWSAIYHAPVKVNDATNRNIKRQRKPQHWGGISAGNYSVERGGPRLMRSVIYCKSEHRRSKHCTQKPEGIIRPLIQYSVPKDGLVLDPFMGSGTTLRVARDMGRRAIGIDADEECCKMAVLRLQQEPLLVT